MGRPIFSPGFHTALSRDHARQLDAALSTAQIHDSDEHHHSKHLHEPTHHDDPARTDPFAHQPPIREQFLSPTSPEGIQVILQGRTAHLSPLALSLLSRVDHAVLVQGRRFEERRTEEGWVYVHIHGDKGELEIVGELVGAGDEQEGETSESESDDDGLMAVDNSEAGVREREARSAMRRSRFTIDVPFHSSHVAVPRTGASFVGSAGRPRLSPGPGLTPSGHRPHPPSRVDSTDPANIFSAPRPSRLDLPGYMTNTTRPTRPPHPVAGPLTPSSPVFSSDSDQNRPLSSPPPRRPRSRSLSFVSRAGPPPPLVSDSSEEDGRTSSSVARQEVVVRRD